MYGVRSTVCGRGALGAMQPSSQIRIVYFNQAEGHMTRPSHHFLTSFLVLTATLLFAVSAAFAQKDTVEFKFIPKYYPDEGRYVEGPPVELAHKPEIVFPSDLKLQGKNAGAQVDR